MIIQNKSIILRDLIENDIVDHLKWRQTEIEWQNWDAPWEKEDHFDSKEFSEKMLKKINNKLKDDDIHHSFQICLNNSEQTHIGWVNAYYISNNPNLTGKLAIGIDIPSKNMRSHGFGILALKLFIEYLQENEYNEIYLQTWSGNKSMIHVAKKLKFIEINRISDIRLVNEKSYDALIFVLKTPRDKTR